MKRGGLPVCPHFSFDAITQGDGISHNSQYDVALELAGCTKSNSFYTHCIYNEVMMNNEGSMDL